MANLKVNFLRKTNLSHLQMFLYSAFGAIAIGSFFTGFARKAGLSTLEIGIMNGLMGSCSLFSIFASWLYESIKRIRLLFISIFIASVLFFYVSVILGYFTYSMQGNLKVAIIVFAFLFFLLYVSSITILLPWLNSIVSKRDWYSFFANRLIIGGIAAFAANFLAGRYLGNNPGILNFIIVFSIASFLGIASTLSIIRMPIPSGNEQKKFEIKNYLRNVRRCIFGEKFYIILISQFFKAFGSTMIVPFIVLFLLEEIQIGYFQIAKLLNVSLVVALIGYKIAGYLTKKFGNYTVYKYSLLLGLIIPVLFSISKSDYYFIYYIIYFLTGFYESSWLLSGVGVIFDYAKTGKKSVYNSLQSMAGGLGAILAPIIGGLLIKYFNSLQINISIFGVTLTSYRILFLVSIIFTGISVIILFLNKTQNISIDAGQTIR
ncbi:MAG: MFS transporter [Actinobacteria bacterium]|nr:MFS transporter [Actinomycetota bacterium]